jgi:hypothetical protein
MKIVSKYHDYYDSIMRTGYDDNIVFVRRGWDDDPIPIKSNNSWRTGSVSYSKYESVIKNYVNPDYFDFSFMSTKPSIWKTARAIEKAYVKKTKRRKIRNITVNPYIVGFCGRFFIVYKVTYVSEVDEITYKNIVYDKNQFADNLKPAPLVGEYPDIFTGNINQLFLDLECPIFWLDCTMHRHKDKLLVRNPILEKVGFQKIIDPYTAYQELSMFFGSVFANDEDNMVNISDNDKARSKGFDKWSFKKLPTKRKVK